MRLTLKQRKFVLAFVGEANGNGTKAARLAGYKGKELTLRVVASENLTKSNVLELIAELRSDAEQKAAGKILSATEVLVGLTRIAEADLAEVFESDGSFDLQKAKKRGVSRLIKSLKFDKDTGTLTHVELHNAHAAHVDLGKYHALFTEKLAIANLDSEIEKELAELDAEEKAGVPLTPASEAIN